MTLVRSHRGDGGIVRFYVGDNLIGAVHRVRVTARGRKAWRWAAKPAAYAWTLGRPDATPVPYSLTEQLEMTITRRAAEVFLVEYLRRHNAPAVAPLYGDDRG